MPSTIASILARLPIQNAQFIQPMECLAVSKLRDGPEWIYEIKLDGYRAVGVKPTKSAAKLFSRNGKLLNSKFPLVAEALNKLPDGTVVDGEIVALDDDGHPNFDLLTGSKKSAGRIRFYVFDLLCLKNRTLVGLPLLKRRGLLTSALKFAEPLRLLEYFQTSSDQMLSVVREHRLEGVVAKRLDRLYEPGRRTGAWLKHRINQADGFVIGGYMPGTHGLDSIIVGEHTGKELMYVARIRAGFVPALRKTVHEKLRPLIIETCPFANLPEAGRSRWGDILDAKKMEQCIWIKPTLTATIEFLERTEGNRLRHSSFLRLNE